MSTISERLRERHRIDSERMWPGPSDLDLLAADRIDELEKDFEMSRTSPETKTLDDPLADLVSRFSAALLEKLRAAEKKYGYDNGWSRNDWQAECQRHLNEHLAKGDPRDVAAYCAFLWHHGWPTIGPITPREYELVASLRGHAQRQQEPVAYRWRQPGNKHWIYDPTPEWIEDHKHEIELEALYTLADTSTLQHPAAAGLEDPRSAPAGDNNGSDRGPRPITWPNRCYDPDSCARHFGCMYVQCLHMKRDGNELAQEIRAVVVSSPDRCAECNYPRSEHSHNGACYGLCGEFVPPSTSPESK